MIFAGNEWIPRVHRIEIPSAELLVLHHQGKTRSWAYLPSPVEGSRVPSIEEEVAQKGGILEEAAFGHVFGIPEEAAFRHVFGIPEEAAFGHVFGIPEEAAIGHVFGIPAEAAFGRVFPVVQEAPLKAEAVAGAEERPGELGEEGAENLPLRLANPRSYPGPFYLYGVLPEVPIIEEY